MSNSPDPLFEHAMQLCTNSLKQMLLVVDRTFNECKIVYELSGLFEYGCLFLGVLLSNFHSEQWPLLHKQTQQLLERHALEGKTLFQQMQRRKKSANSAPKSVTAMKHVVRESATEYLIQRYTGEVFKELAETIFNQNHEWKKTEYTSEQRADLKNKQDLVIKKFQDIVETTLRQFPNLDPDAIPERFMLNMFAAYFGKLWGLAAELYHLSPEKFAGDALEKIDVGMQRGFLHQEVLH